MWWELKLGMNALRKIQAAKRTSAHFSWCEVRLSLVAGSGMCPTKWPMKLLDEKIK